MVYFSQIRGMSSAIFSLNNYRTQYNTCWQ